MNTRWYLKIAVFSLAICCVLAKDKIATAQDVPLPAVPMFPQPDPTRLARGSGMELKMWNPDGKTGTYGHIMENYGHDQGYPELGAAACIGNDQFCDTYDEVLENIRTWAPGFESDAPDAEINTPPYWKNWMGAPIVQVLMQYVIDAIEAEIASLQINFREYLSFYQPAIPPPPLYCTSEDNCPGYTWRCGKHFQYPGGQVGRCWWVYLSLDYECLFMYWKTSSLVEYYSPSYKMDASEQEYQSLYYIDGLTDLLRGLTMLELSLIPNFRGIMSMWSMMWTQHALTGGILHEEETAKMLPFVSPFALSLGEQDRLLPDMQMPERRAHGPLEFHMPSQAPNIEDAEKAYQDLVRKIRGGDDDGNGKMPMAEHSQPHLNSVFGRAFPEPLDWLTAEFPYVPHVPKMTPPDERQGPQLPFFGMDAPIPFGSYIHSKFLPATLLPPLIDGDNHEGTEEWAKKLALYALWGPRACMMNNKFKEAHEDDSPKTPHDADWDGKTLLQAHSLPLNANMDNDDNNSDGDVEICLDKIGEVFPITDNRRAHVTDGTWQGALKGLNAMFYYYPLTDNQGMDGRPTHDQNSHHSFIRKVDIWDPLKDSGGGDMEVGRTRLADETEPGVIDDITKVNMEYEWANVKTARGGGENTFEMYPLYKGCWKPDMKGKVPRNEGFPMLAAGVFDAWWHLITPFPPMGWMGFNTAPEPEGLFYHFWPFTFMSKISRATHTKNKLRLY